MSRWICGDAGCAALGTHHLDSRRLVAAACLPFDSSPQVFQYGRILCWSVSRSLFLPKFAINHVSKIQNSFCPDPHKSSVNLIYPYWAGDSLFVVFLYKPYAIKTT